MSIPQRASLRKTLADRFWSYVDKTGGPDACWPWIGYRDNDGYGRLGIPHRKTVKAHRLAYELQNGPIPAGLSVCHKCDNPPCCNGRHLFTGTQPDNMRDRFSKGRYNPKIFTPYLDAALPPDRCAELRKVWETKPHPSVTVLAQQYGVDRATILAVVGIEINEGLDGR